MGRMRILPALCAVVSGAPLGAFPFFFSLSPSDAARRAASIYALRYPIPSVCSAPQARKVFGRIFVTYFFLGGPKKIVTICHRYNYIFRNL